MDTTLLYNVPPPAGKLNGVFVTADSPGIPPFAFHAQHGSMKSDVTPDDVTGFAACTKAVSVRVRDARKETEAPTLDTHGFTLLTDARVDAATAHAELHDDAHVRSRYYTEMEALAKSAFPGACTHSRINVRRQSRQQEAPDAKRPRHAAGLSAPSYMVHSDCTHLSWQARLQELHREGTLGATASSELSAEQLEALASAKRLIVLNLWRLVANFSQPTPTHLAVCDVRSVDLTADVLPYRFCVDGCVGHNHGPPPIRAPSTVGITTPASRATRSSRSKLSTAPTPWRAGSRLGASMRRWTSRTRRPSAGRANRSKSGWCSPL